MTTNATSQTRPNVTDLASLQNYIRQLEGSNSTENRTATSSSGEQSISAREATLRTQNITSIESMRDQVQNFINKRKNRYVDAAPLYLKPAFFLDQWTPYLRLEFIYFQRKNPDNLNSELVEKRLDILSDPINDVNNHVKSFKYTVINEGNEPNIEISLIDINQEILDFMVLQFVSIERLSNITGYIKVTYGWYNNKLNSPSDMIDYNKIAFTNSVYGLITNVKVNYTSGGIPEATITATADNGFTGELRHLNPYNILGTMPAVTLSIKEFFVTVDRVFDYLKRTARNDNDKKLCLGYLIGIMHDKGVRDNGACLGTLRAVVNYYKLIDTAYSTLENLIAPSVTQYSNASTDNAMFNNIKRTTGGFNLMPELTNAIARDKITTTEVQEKDKQPLYHYEFKNYLQAPVGRTVNGKILFTTQSQKRAWINMFRTVGTMIQDNYLIHPYFVWRYCLNIFEDKIVEHNNARSKDPKTIKVIYLDGIDIDNSRLFPRSEPATRQIELQNAKWMQKDYIATGETNKVFYKRADTYMIQPFETWKDFLAQVSGDCQMKYLLTPAAAQLYGVEAKSESVSGTDLLMGTRSATPVTINFAPMRINTNFFVCDKKAADLNIEIYKRALQARLRYLENSPEPSGGGTVIQAIRATARDTVTRALNGLNELKKTITNDGKYYMFVMRDAMSSEQVFNPEVALNNIVQAYSYNINGVYTRDKNGFFNPGKPSCLHVNFPDVLSFQPEIDYHNLMRGLMANAQITSEYEHLDEIVSENTQTRREDILRQANDAISTRGGNARDAGFINTLKGFAEQLQSLGPTNDPTLETTRATERVQLNTFDYSMNRISGGQMDMSLARKRDVQELRKKLLLAAMPFKAEISVIGDASFTFRDAQYKHIFLKFTNLDGSLSMFSGIYSIENIVHEITNGQFKTTHKTMCQRSFNDPSSLSQINAMIYNTDRQSINPINNELGE